MEGLLKLSVVLLVSLIGLGIVSYLDIVNIRAGINKILAVAGLLPAINESIYNVSAGIGEVKDAISKLAPLITSVNSSISSKVDSVSSKLDTVNSNVGSISSKLDTVSSKVDTISSNVGSIKSKIDAATTYSVTVSVSQPASIPSGITKYNYTNYWIYWEGTISSTGTYDVGMFTVTFDSPVVVVIYCGGGYYTYGLSWSVTVNAANAVYEIQSNQFAGAGRGYFVIKLYPIKTQYPGQVTPTAYIYVSLTVQSAPATIMHYVVLDVWRPLTLR